MKTTFLFLTICFSFISLSKAQDLIYTLVGTINNENTSIDSISVENQTNGKQIGFGNLPIRNDYRINLSKRSFWGSTHTETFPSEQGFRISGQNQGLLSLRYRGAALPEANIFIFNINGQSILYQKAQNLLDGSTLQIKIGQNGIFFVRIITARFAQTFKIIGEEEHRGFEIYYGSEGQKEMRNKSHSLLNVQDFSFQPGDRLGLSVFKVGYQADPIHINIQSDERFVFAFRKMVFAPSVLTLEAFNIQLVSATLHGELVSDGGSEPVERGFYWSSSNSNPGKSDNVIPIQEAKDSFIFILNGLNENTTYYYVAYARNSEGEKTGLVKSFKTHQKTSDSFIDERDGTTYKTVKIGDQWWMAENLAWIPIGGELPGVYSPFFIPGYTSQSIEFGKTTSNYERYGVLYRWSAAMLQEGSSNSIPSKVRGACPIGWHMPSDAEWKQLETALGLSGQELDLFEWRGDDVGHKLKSREGWLLDGNGNNQSGFTAIPAGRCVQSIFSFVGAGSDAYWWSATLRTNDSFNAIGRSLESSKPSINRNFYSTTVSEGLSVRCVKDDNRPDISTIVPLEITSNSFKLSAQVGNAGSNPVTLSGFYVSRENPLPDDSDLSVDANFSDNAFSVLIEGLIPGTRYYIRAFAENIVGKSYTDTYSLKTREAFEFGSYTDERDGKVYKTVLLNGKKWMAENLAYLPSVSPPANYSTTDSNYYVYGFTGFNADSAKLTDNYHIHGVLYNSSAATTACPSGWSLPTADDFSSLYAYITAFLLKENQFDTSVKQLSSVSNWKGSSVNGSPGNNPGINNASGFSILPSGKYYSSGKSFTGLGSYAYLHNGSNGFSIHFDLNKSQNASLSSSDGWSIRCYQSDQRPLVDTKEPLSITDKSVLLNGEIASTGASAIIEKGFFWSTTHTNPDEVDHKETVQATGNPFSKDLADLDGSTDYYYRAYAINSEGITLGKTLAFKTKKSPDFGEFTDPRDGKTYKTVKIGRHEWMAENLAYLPFVNNHNENSTITKHYYVYGYNDDNPDTLRAKASENYKKYGVLYNWPAALNGVTGEYSFSVKVQGACPSGWFIPGEVEWTDLGNQMLYNKNNYDGSNFLNKYAKALSSKTSWNVSTTIGSPGSNPTLNDISGFSGLAAGFYYDYKSFSGLGIVGHWVMNLKKDDLTYVCKVIMHSGIGYREESFRKSIGNSIRCVRVNETRPDTLPLVITTGNTAATLNSVQLTGDLINDGGSQLIQRGFYWSKTNPDPDENDRVAYIAYPHSDFAVTLENLDENTPVYYVAFAQNNQGIGKGGTRRSASKTKSPPDVLTSSVIDLTLTSCKLKAEIITDDSVPVLEKGFYWSMNQSSPGKMENKIVVTTSGNSYSLLLEGLVNNNPHYYCAFIKTEAGEKTGEIKQFNTLGTFTDTRDGKVYQTLKFGDQTWMAENLAYLPAVSPNSIGSTSAKHYYVFGYNGNDLNEAKNTEYYAKYGVLYNWPAAMDGKPSSNAVPSGVRGVCPAGWHLPSDKEWMELEIELGVTPADANNFGWRNSSIGKDLKALSGWTSSGNGNNSIGFNTLPSGARYNYSPYCIGLNTTAYYWSSTQSSVDNSVYRYLYYLINSEERSDITKDTGMSVRCIKD